MILSADNSAEVQKPTVKAELAQSESEAFDAEQDPAQSSTLFNERKNYADGWFVGRMCNNTISCLLFGQFTRDLSPPVGGWVYVGRNIEVNTVPQLWEVIQGYLRPDEELEYARGDVIKVTEEELYDESLAAKHGKKPNCIRIYRVKGCSFSMVNGRYVPDGEVKGFPVYRNVRGWTIMHASLVELPELGIFSESCYDMAKGPSFSTIMDNRAFAANDAIVSSQSTLTDGSADFKWRFSELCRSGTRLITADQISQILSNELMRASLRTKTNEMLLLALQARGSSDEVASSSSLSAARIDGDDAENAVVITSEGEVDGGPSIANMSSLTGEIKPEMTSSVISIDLTSPSVPSKLPPLSPLSRSQPLSPSRAARSRLRVRSSISSASTNGRLTAPSSPSAAAATLSETKSKFLTGAELEAQLTLSRKIVYQVGSQGYPLANEKSTRPTFVTEEAQLAAEVTKRIEQREIALHDLHLESEYCLKVYLEELSTAPVNVLQAFREGPRGFSPKLNESIAILEAKMESLRQTTIEVAECLGGWARLCLIQKRRKKLLEDGGVHTAGYAVNNRREFCVFVAMRGKTLFAQSKPVKSFSKRFSRSLEPEQRAVETTFVGNFLTRDEAIAAFHKARAQIPPQNELPAPKGTSEMYIGLRPCGKHYIVRAYGVPSNMACEQCAAMSVRHPTGVVPFVSVEPFPQFLYNGSDYLAKMWTDLLFLEKNVVLEKVMPDVDIKFNPLLLRRRVLSEALAALKLRHGESGWDALTFLRSAEEQHRDALKASKTRPSDLTGYELSVVPYAADIDATRISLAAGKDHTEHPPGSASVDGAVDDIARLREQRRKGFWSSEGAKSIFDFFVKPVEKKNTVTDQNFTCRSTLLPDRGNLEHMLQQKSTTTVVKKEHSINNKKLQDGPATDDEQLVVVPSSSSKVSKSVAWTPDVQSSTPSLSLRHQSRGVSAGFSPGSFERMLRSLSILGQCSCLTKDKLNALVISAAEEIINASTTSATAPRGFRGMQGLAKEHAKTARFGRNLAVSSSLDSLTNTNTQHENDSADEILGSATRTRRRSRSKDQLVVTEAAYSYRGAVFSTEQYRQAPAYREDDVFCRYDEGEWASLSKGRAVRSFLFHEKIKLDGKLKAAERARVQAQLRKMVKLHFADCDVALARNLILRAKALRGPVLALDVIQMEQYLTAREKVVKAFIRYQSLYRGFKCRKIFFHEQTQRRLAAQHEMERLAICKETAQLLAANYLSTAVARHVKRIRKPVFRIAAHMSGLPVTVSVYMRSRFSQKSLELCPSCRGTNFTPTYRGLYEMPISTNKPVFKNSKKLNHSQSLWTGVRERPPCTCCIVQTVEQWTLKAMDPLTQRVYIKNLSMFDVRRTVIDMLSSGKLMPSGKRTFSPVEGKGSFYPIEALFNAAFGVFDGSRARSPTAALLRASEESSVLPKLPRALSRPLDSAIHTMAPREIIKLHTYGFHSSERPETVENIRSMFHMKPPEWEWSPFADADEAYRAVEWIKHYALELERVWVNSVQDVKDAEDFLENHAKANLERRNMESEDSRATVWRTRFALIAADGRIRRVMITSKANLEHVIQEQLQLKEDWKQAWDKYDDGNEWVNLNMKRKIEPVWNRQLEEFLATRLPVKLAEEVLVQAYEQLDTAIRLEAHNRKVLEDFRPHLPFAEEVALKVKDLSSQIVHSVAATFSLPTKNPNAASRRRLQKVPFNIVFARDALVRTRPEYRAGWELMDRRILALRPQREHFLYTHRDRHVFRCVVEAFLDPVTKYVIIHLDTGGEDDTPMEEFVGHEDFNMNKEDFAHMSPCKRHEIILKPDIIDHILSREPTWPGGHLQQYRVVDCIPYSDLSSALSAPCSGANGLPKAIENVEIETRTPRSARGIGPTGLDFSSYTASPRLFVENGSASGESSSRRAPHVLTRPSSSQNLLRLLNQPVIGDPHATRPLDGHKPWKTHRHELIYLPNTYQGRRLSDEDAHRIRAVRLVNFLKLQPHSLRPCLGLLHLERRKEIIEKRVVACEWFIDNLRGTPKKYSFAYLTQLYFLSRRVVVANIRCTFESFEITLTFEDGNAVEIVVSFLLILESMIFARRPALLASLLCETIINRFSQDTLQFILDRTELHLPGELRDPLNAIVQSEVPFRSISPENIKGGEPTHLLWRQSLYNEIPTVTFARLREESLRGPVYVLHQFISGFYARVRTKVTFAGDVRFDIEPPTNNKFKSNLYLGDPLRIDVSRDEMRAFAATASLRPDIVPKRFLNNLDLLHPHNMEELFRLFLGSIVLANGVADEAIKSYQQIKSNRTPSGANPNKDKKPEGALLLLRNGSQKSRKNCSGVSEEEEVDESDDDDGFKEHCAEVRQHGEGATSRSSAKLRSKVILIIRRFNSWVRRRNIKVAQLRKNVREMVMSSVDALDEASKWSISLQMLAARRFELYSAVLNAVDQDMVCGEQDFDSVRTGTTLRKRSVAEMASSEARSSVSTGVFEQNEKMSLSKDVIPIEILLKNFWRVHILTDETKTKLFLQLVRVGIEDPTVEKAATLLETERMEMEDDRSRRVSRMREEAEWQSFLVSQVKSYERKISHDLIPRLNEFERRHVAWRRDLGRQRKAVMLAYSAAIQASKERLLACVLSSLRWRDGNLDLAVHVEDGNVQINHNYMKHEMGTFPSAVHGNQTPQEVANTMAFLNNMHNRITSAIAEGVASQHHIFVAVSTIPVGEIRSKIQVGIPTFPDGRILRSTADYVQCIDGNLDKVTSFREPIAWRRRQIVRSAHSVIAATSASNLTSKHPIVDKLAGPLRATGSNQRNMLLSATTSSSVFRGVITVGNHTLLRTECTFSEGGNVVKFGLYDPESQRCWRIQASASGLLFHPLLTHQDVSQANKDDSRANSSDEVEARVIASHVTSVGQLALKSFMIRSMAEHTVARALVDGMSAASVLLAADAIDRRSEVIEADLSKALERIDFFNNHLKLESKLMLKYAATENSLNNHNVSETLRKVRRQSLSLSLNPGCDSTGENEGPDGRVPLHVIFVPLQDQTKHTVHTVHSQLLPVLIGRYLGCDPNDSTLIRTHTLSTICYSQKPPDHRDTASLDPTLQGILKDSIDATPYNPRVNLWNSQFHENHGWSEAASDEREKLQEIFDRESFAKMLPKGIGTNLCGDILLVLRRPHLDAEKFEIFMEKYRKDHMPMWNYRRTQAARNRKKMLDNFGVFRRRIFSLAATFRRGFEALHDLSGDKRLCGPYDPSIEVPPFISRVLLARFYVLRKILDKKALQLQMPLEDRINSLEELDEAFLLDSYVALGKDAEDEKLKRFENIPDGVFYTERMEPLRWDYSIQYRDIISPADILSFPKRNKNAETIEQDNEENNCSPVPEKDRLIENEEEPVQSRMDLQPRVGQLVYAIFHLHCMECVKPMSICTFPGCAHIRSEAMSELQTPSASIVTVGFGKSAAIPELTNISQFMVDLIGTGQHPVEKAIKRYLLTVSLDGPEITFSAASIPHALTTDSSDEIPIQKSLAFVSNLGCSHPPPHLVEQSELNFHGEMAAEMANLYREAQRKAYLDLLALRWRDVERDARILRYVDRRCVQPAMARVVSGDDVAAVRPFVEQWNNPLALEANPVADEAKIRRDARRLVEARQLLPNGSAVFATGDESRGFVSSKHTGKRRRSLDDGGDGAHHQTQHINDHSFTTSKNIIEVPACFFFPIIDRNLLEEPTDATNKVPPLLGDVRVVNSSICATVVSRLRLYRPQGASHRGSEALPEIFIDRTHSERVITFPDGCLVTIHALYGVLPSTADPYLAKYSLSYKLRSSSIARDKSERPVLRLCPIEILSLLEEGLTLLIYDTVSDTMLMLDIQGRPLARIADYLEIERENLPAIAQGIVQNAEKIVQLYRIDGRLVAASIDLHTNPGAPIASVTPRHRSTPSVSPLRRLRNGKAGVSTPHFILETFSTPEQTSKHKHRAACRNIAHDPSRCKQQFKKGMRCVLLFEMKTKLTKARAFLSQAKAVRRNQRAATRTPIDPVDDS